MDTLKVLREARTLIARGYTTGQRYDGFGRFCALGALDAAGGGYQLHDIGIMPAVNALAAEIPGEPENIRNLPTPNRVAYYNNSTDQARTVALFDRAIAKLEAKEFMTKLKSSIQNVEIIKENSDVVCV